MPLVLSGTDGVSGVDGTASNPAIEGTDSNTGIFYPAADTVAIGTGGTERLRVDSAGNAGLGVTPPATFSGYTALNLSATSIYNFSASGNRQTHIYNNGFINSSGNAAYINTDAASRIYMTNGTIQFGVAGSGSANANITFNTAMTLDASGNLLVGTTTAFSPLTVNGSNRFDTVTFGDITTASNNCGIYLRSTGAAGISWAGGGYLAFFGGGVGSTERARITSDGNLLVGKTAANVGVDGCEVGTNYLAVSRPAAPPLIVNRNTDDGTLVSFRQATVEEGTISVSGTTVSYNGGHLARWSQLLNGQRDESIVKGTVLSNLDEMCEWFDAEGNPLPNEQLNRMKVSDVEGDANVAGVFVNWDNDDQDNPYDMNIAMTGDMIIRIAQGVTVQKGDLLMSAGDGTAKPQGDDIVRSKTVAKVTSNHVTCTYDDGSYCVPCVLMAC